MSKRRNKGDLVWLKPCSGFLTSSHEREVEIMEQSGDICLLECDDPECQEWDVWTIADEKGDRFALYHVSECQMLDKRWRE